MPQRQIVETVTEFSISLRIVRLGEDLVFATTTISGVLFRSGSRKNAREAVQSLFQVLGGVSGNSDDTAIAIELAMKGMMMSDLAPRITDGHKR